MASQEIVTMECFQWINRLMLNARYLTSTQRAELAGTNQEASSIGLIYVFISSRIELH